MAAGEAVVLEDVEVAFGRACAWARASALLAEGFTRFGFSGSLVKFVEDGDEALIAARR